MSLRSDELTELIAADEIECLFGPEREELQQAVIATYLARALGYQKIKPKHFLVWGDRAKGPRLSTPESQQAHLRAYAQQQSKRRGRLSR